MSEFPSFLQTVNGSRLRYGHQEQLNNFAQLTGNPVVAAAGHLLSKNRHALLFQENGLQDELPHNAPGNIEDLQMHLTCCLAALPVT